MLCLCAFLAALLQAQTQENLESEIRTVDARRVDALIHANIQVLDQLLSPDLVYTHASGWRQNKAEFLASIRSGELNYRVFTTHIGNIRVHGNTVVVSGDASVSVKAKGQDLNVNLLFLEVYVNQDGRWQLAAWQSTRSVP